MESSTSMSQLEERLLKLRCPEDQVKSPQIEIVQPKMNIELLLDEISSVPTTEDLLTELKLKTDNDEKGIQVLRTMRTISTQTSQVNEEDGCCLFVCLFVCLIV
jgi:hypothetical protein